MIETRRLFGTQELDTGQSVAEQTTKSAASGTECGPAALLVLDRVSVKRGTSNVLSDISLDLPCGSITAIVGPSGAGKSTLMATLNGLLQPSAGLLSAAGIGRLDSAASLLAHRRRTATVFQEHALIARLSALDNVLLGLADRRNPFSLLPWPRALREQAIAALAEVGLLDKALKPVARLSGGERQRVGIARALVRRPVLLLADEPFASVDPTLTERMADEFRRLVHEHSLTLVIVLHQLDLARQLADRIVGITDGRIAFEGEPDTFDATAQARIFPML
ncbi:phosphonate ABC transporter ATP-binding protein [Azomonas macrocytogenes]|uniref:Phosphonate transport system ATP-binding protein n=1 Tax=Azomonas macrocytogenes TaxID=69962 RepID=A0A839T256_AZOMA|nr:ATP-binding cassette domain-containing protein [Azomonas macrocytogenes]MBB3103188.1 phosphonate transport system ATP-binding protein [Azomonas macrocytogenes]